MQWFRMYGEFANDPKVQMMSEVNQRRLTMLFCLRCGEQNLNEEELAFSLRITPDELLKTKDEFIKKGFIDENWKIINWEERQFISDSSNERVKKYREKRKDMGLTSNGYTKHTETVITRDGGECVYCGATENLCIDHALPINMGGDDSIENLVAACKKCNSGKSGRTPDIAGYSFKNKATENQWKSWLSRHVTVTVTPPDTEQIQITDTEQRRKKEARAPKIEKPADVSETVWKDFCSHRKAKKAPVTETALNGIRKEAEIIAGISLDEALREVCSRGWQGFKAEWYLNAKGKQTDARTGNSKSAVDASFAGFAAAADRYKV